MIEYYYVPSTRITSRIADLVMQGWQIGIDGYHYDRLSRRPKGRAIMQRLVNEEKQQRIIIYA